MSDFKVGDKVIVIESISTIDGTLDEDEICTVDGTTFINADLRLKDSMGRIWYVNEYQVKKLQAETEGEEEAPAEEQVEEPEQPGIPETEGVEESDDEKDDSPEIELKEFESWEKTPITHKINLKDGTSIIIETRIDLNSISLVDLIDEKENFVSPFITYFQTDYRTGEWKGYYLHFVKWDCKNLYHTCYMDITDLADVEDGSDEYFSIVSDIDSRDLSEELFPNHDEYSIV